MARAQQYTLHFSILNFLHSNLGERHTWNFEGSCALTFVSSSLQKVSRFAYTRIINVKIQHKFEKEKEKEPGPQREEYDIITHTFGIRSVHSHAMQKLIYQQLPSSTKTIQLKWGDKKARKCLFSKGPHKYLSKRLCEPQKVK